MSRKLRALAATAAVGLLATVLTVVTQSAQADELVTHHEFQANCSVTVHRLDDPIVSPRLPGASHMHTFLGNNSVNASSTNDSLKNGQTNCRTPDDKSAYWFPSLYNGDQLIVPDFGDDTVVQRVLRSTVDSSRPGRDVQHRPSAVDVGGGVRLGVPDPDLGRRHQLDHRTVGDRWQRR
jgi:hypothetical protein